MLNETIPTKIPRSKDILILDSEITDEVKINSKDEKLRLLKNDVYIGDLKFIYNEKDNNYKLNSLIAYDNGINTAKELSDTFFNKSKVMSGCTKTILFAITQSGKTVVSAVACNIIIDRLLQQGYPKRNIDCYYFSNLSSNQLRNQNAKDFALTNIDQRCIFTSGHLNNYKK
jgi:hypothetical protein